jgi:methylamine dehydrogenase heavy chain
MHQGGEGSHKVGGKEIWVYDTATHQRVARWPIDEKRYGPTVALQVTQDDKPLLFVTTENAAMLVMDATTGKVTHVEAKMGQTPWLLINP